MLRHYSSRNLTEQEWIEIEEVLLDELDIQSWYTVTILNLMDGETFIALQ